MMGKTVDRAAIANHLDIPLIDVVWPQDQLSSLQMTTTHHMAKAGHFGHHWCRLSINQQDHLITTIIEQDQAKPIQFWPDKLAFTPEELDRILALDLPRQNAGFGPSRAGEIIEHVLKDTALGKREKPKRKKSALFEQVFKRMLQKMQKDFGPAENILIETPT